jgi:transcriptional regulator with XRE-family HTH domain
VDQVQREELGRRIRELRGRRSLSQEELAEAVQVARTTVSRWELGLHAPRPDELRRICGAFGVEHADLVPVTSDEVHRREFLRHVAVLGLAAGAGLDPAWSAADIDRLTWSVERQRVDEGTVEGMESIAQRHAELYFRLGSLEMFELVQGHVRTAMLLQQGQMPDDIRRRLAAVITEEAGRAAWHAYDLGRTAASESFYSVAERAGEGADPAMAAYVKAYKSIVRLDAGRIREALALVEDAGEHGRAADPTMRAWIAAMEAQAAAVAQLRPRAELALRRADADLYRAAAKAPGERGQVMRINAQLFWLDHWRLSALAGAMYERLGDGKEASRRIQPALEFLPQRSPRGQSEMLLDLAGIALLRADADEAVQRARDALARARDAQSVACVDRVRRFRLRLHPYGNLPDLAALDHELSAV